MKKYFLFWALSLYCVVSFLACLARYYDKHLYVLKFISIDFFKEEKIYNFAIANLGMVASLMGFLIATMPFLISLIQNDEDLIRETEDLDEIVKSLIFLFMIFVFSFVVLLIKLDYIYLRIIVIATYIFLYCGLFFYLYKLIKILKVLSNCLKDLLKKIQRKSK
ncbi:hypothetical protein [Helicobacter pametensis]|uniref:hypothetical protein n=1 Tax=Helicobacter pametensis TaxID=95149 RepID=UPI000487197E|nr:hypothetical protein [Helicobacter pametensis]